MQKNWFKSRTIWMNAAVVVMPLLPFIQNWAHSDPVHLMQYHAILNILLRLDTNSALVLKSFRGKEEG